MPAVAIEIDCRPPTWDRREEAGKEKGRTDPRWQVDLVEGPLQGEWPGGSPRACGYPSPIPSASALCGDRAERPAEFGPSRGDAPFVLCPAPHGLSERIARLAERMNTMQAEYCSDLTTLAKDMADRNAEAADRAARGRGWQVGITLAAIVVAIAILKFA